MQKKQNLYHQPSYWERQSFFRDIDIAVIGSGIVGLNAALRARELAPKARIVVLERGPFPLGASTRNAGFACFGSVSELLEDMEKQGLDASWRLVERRWQGLQRLRSRLGDERLQYREWGGFELFRESEADRFEYCQQAIAPFNRLLEGITGKKEVYRLAGERAAEFGLGRVPYLIENTAEGQLHTGEMMRALLELAQEQGIRLYNGISIQSVKELPNGVELRTQEGWPFRVGRVIVATNGFARQLLPQLEVRPARNQVMITAPIPGLKIKGCFHYDRGYYYFRNIDGRILLGGGRNLDPRGETTDAFGNNPFIRRALINLLREVVLPGREVEIEQWWSGILGVGNEKMPIVKSISPRIVVAVRLGGMGVAIGSLVGEQGAEMLLGPPPGG